MHKQAEQFSNCKPELKIVIAMEMSDMCMQICATGIRSQNPDIDEKHLLEELRKRIEWMKRHRIGKRRLIV